VRKVRLCVCLARDASNIMIYIQKFAPTPHHYSRRCNNIFALAADSPRLDAVSQQFVPTRVMYFDSVRATHRNNTKAKATATWIVYFVPESGMTGLPLFVEVMPAIFFIFRALYISCDEKKWKLRPLRAFLRVVNNISRRWGDAKSEMLQKLVAVAVEG
jgi:hypothetical protein